MVAITNEEVLNCSQRKKEFFWRLDNFLVALRSNMGKKYTAKFINDKVNKKTILIIRKCLPWHKRLYSAIMWKLRYHGFISVDLIPKYDKCHGLTMKELNKMKRLVEFCFIGVSPTYLLETMFKYEVEMLRHVFVITHEF